MPFDINKKAEMEERDAKGICDDPWEYQKKGIPFGDEDMLSFPCRPAPGGSRQLRSASEAESLRGDPRFLAILEEMRQLHVKKSHDYGSSRDAFANLRASSAFGVDPFVAAMIRLNDKIVRIQQFIAKGRLQNESVYDALDDIACYAIIARILLSEKMQDAGELQEVSEMRGDQASKR